MVVGTFRSHSTLPAPHRETAVVKGVELGFHQSRAEDCTSLLTGRTKIWLHDHAVARSSASSPNPVANRPVSRDLGTR
jgi:hypothetical protein